MCIVSSLYIESKIEGNVSSVAVCLYIGAQWQCEGALFLLKYEETLSQRIK